MKKIKGKFTQNWIFGRMIQGGSGDLFIIHMGKNIQLVPK